MTDLSDFLDRAVTWYSRLRQGEADATGRRSPVANVGNRYEMTYEDANAHGTIHGGEIVKRMDTVAGHTAREYGRGPAVTVSMDRAEFQEPVAIGDTLEVDARLDYVGESSMMIHVDAYVRDYAADTLEKTTEAYFTFVAVDDDGDPRPVPDLALATETERVQYERAKAVKERLER